MVAPPWSHRSFSLSFLFMMCTTTISSSHTPSRACRCFKIKASAAEHDRAARQEAKCACKPVSEPSELMGKNIISKMHATCSTWDFRNFQAWMLSSDPHCLHASRTLRLDFLLTIAGNILAIYQYMDMLNWMQPAGREIIKLLLQDALAGRAVNKGTSVYFWNISVMLLATVHRVVQCILTSHNSADVSQCQEV